MPPAPGPADPAAGVTSPAKEVVPVPSHGQGKPGSPCCTCSATPPTPTSRASRATRIRREGCGSRTHRAHPRDRNREVRQDSCCIGCLGSGGGRLAVLRQGRAADKIVAASMIGMVSRLSRGLADVNAREFWCRSRSRLPGSCASRRSLPGGRPRRAAACSGGAVPGHGRWAGMGWMRGLRPTTATVR